MTTRVAKKSSKRRSQAAAPAAAVALRRTLGMTRSTFARLLGRSERAIIEWEKGASKPQGLSEQRLTELRRLTALLEEVIAPAEVGPWFVTPNKAFGELKPIEVVERGEIDRLWKMVYELHSGGHA